MRTRSTATTIPTGGMSARNFMYPVASEIPENHHATTIKETREEIPVSTFTVTSDFMDAPGSGLVVVTSYGIFLREFVLV